MGTIFDFFGNESSTDYQDLSDTVKQNRFMLKNTMETYGFENYSKEWWHYTLTDEPYHDTYFNFAVE